MGVLSTFARHWHQKGIPDWVHFTGYRTVSFTMLYPSNSQTTSFLSLPFFPVMWHMSDTVVTCLEVCQPPSQPSTKAFHRYITPWCHMAWCHMVPHGVTWCHMVPHGEAINCTFAPYSFAITSMHEEKHTRACVCVLYIIYNCKIIVYTHTYIYIITCV